MSTKQYPTAEYLWQCFRYEDGKLFWRTDRPLHHFKNDRYRRAYASNDGGNEAGRARKDGRCMITIKGLLFLRSRLVWLMHNGSISGFIDHINRNTSDDRIENLRECTQSQNMMNASINKRNSSGARGVIWSDRTGGWVASIAAYGKSMHLGYFKKKSDAIEARVKASKRIFGEFSNEEIGDGDNQPASNAKASIGKALENRAGKRV